MNIEGYLSLEKLAQPGPIRELWSMAAITEAYQPSALLTNWMEVQKDLNPNQQREAMRATLELQAVGIQGFDLDGHEALRLPSAIRKTVLQALGVEGSLKYLKQFSDKDKSITEQLFMNLLSNKPISVDRNDRPKLTALQVASDWAKAAGVPEHVGSLQIGEQLKNLDFLQTLGGEDLGRFVGRTNILYELHSIWSEEGSHIVLLDGPGGVGKSLTVSRFVADLLQNDNEQQRPHAIFHFDFDRQSLQKARLATLLQEVVRQVKHWWLPRTINSNAALQQRFMNLERFVLSGGTEKDSYGISRSGESMIFKLLDSLTSTVLDILVSSSNQTPRLVIFVDSYEQIDLFNDHAVDSIEMLISQFIDKKIKILVIVCSRSFSPYNSFKRYFTNQTIHLGQFSKAEATIYLKNEADRIGLSVMQKTLDKVQSMIGRSPLALRLAVALIEKEGDNFDISAWGKLTQESELFVQATLYDRLLKRIRNPELRKIAMPGLLVRRLTVDIINKVLAEPCKLSPESFSAGELMSEARKEGQLFVADSQDSEALWHRQDVRATMLGNLDRSISADVARDINLRAISYYMLEGNSIIFRAEELYHRLRLNQPPSDLDKRWSDEAGRLLKSVQNELPAQARAYLRGRLGGESKKAFAIQNRSVLLEEIVRQEAEFGSIEVISSPDQADYISSRITAEEVGTELSNLQSGTHSSSALLYKWEREGQRLDVPLGVVYASVLVRTAKHEQLLRAARSLLILHPKKEDASNQANILSIAAALLEGKGVFREAQSFWMPALRVASQGLQKEVELGCLIGSIRIRRKLGTGEQKRAAEINRAIELLKDLDHTIRKQRVVTRETAAELSELLLLERSAKKHYQIERLLKFIVDVDEVFPSVIGKPERIIELSAKFFQENKTTSISMLNDLFTKLLYGDKSSLQKAIHILREEVDWTLANVVVDTEVAEVANYHDGGGLSGWDMKN